MGQISGEMLLFGEGPAAALELTDEQAAEVGEGRKAFPVAVEINGKRVQLRLSRMNGRNLIGFSKAKRAEARVEMDTTVSVVISLDEGERVVEVPPALADALAANPEAAAAFEKLAYSHRKEHARSVAEAKKDETRDRRVAKVIEKLTS